MTTISDTTSELADLYPALAAALARDKNPEAVSGHSWLPGNLVNEDVHAAQLLLGAEVPAVTRAAFEGIERWTSRDVGTCLAALPRLAARLHALERIGDEKHLTAQASGWLRVTKRALGLRRPDLQLCPCPYAPELPDEHARAWMLLRAGDEGFLRPGPDGLQVEWVKGAVIYCRPCGASWDEWQWAFLGRLLERVYGETYRSGLARVS